MTLPAEEKRAGTREFAGMIRRCLAKYPARVRDGSSGLDSLAQLAEIQAILDRRTTEVVEALRSAEGGSYSWAEIAGALGITRQAAQKRWAAQTAPGARSVGGQPSHLR